MAGNKKLLEQISSTLKSGDATVPNIKYYGIPSGDTYRWIVPQDKFATLAVLSSWHPYNLSSRLKLGVLKVMMAVLGVARSPGLHSFGELPSCDNLMVRNLCNLNLEKIHAVFYIGTPCPQRKAVCHLVAETKEVLAVLKIPLEDGAKASIAREAIILEELREFGPKFSVPKLLGHDKTKGISAQSWLAGEPLGRAFTPAHADLLVKMRGVGQFELGAHVKQLRQRAERVASVLPDISQIMAKIDAIDSNLKGPCIWQHGDFAPWNLRKKDNSLALFDWEDGTKHGLPVWDMAHFFAMQAHLFKEDYMPFVAMQHKGYFDAYLSDMSLTRNQGVTLFNFYCLAQGIAAYERDNMEFGQFLFSCLE